MTRFHATVNGLVPFTKEEELERDAEEAAWLAGQNDKKAKEIREKRNTLLAECDWVVLKAMESNFINPNPPSLEWLNYRQQLRDIPSQGGFPLNVTWPEKP